jgi:glycosyltransferase involved in cell wall biosynthesis
VPKFPYGYTVSDPIQKVFLKDYGVNYKVIRNVPFLQEATQEKKGNFILYQGAVNHGRSFETLIPAFQWIDRPFWIYGDGNFYDECLGLIENYNLQEKVLLKGKTLPGELRSITPKAVLGITLFENNGLSNYYSLGNRFFDYMQAALPQLCVDYPAYREINQEFEVAVLIDDLSSESLAAAINSLLNNKTKLEKLHRNCLAAREVYNWQQEEKKLLQFYQQVLSD